jgi:hypothetical protein
LTDAYDKADNVIDAHKRAISESRSSLLIAPNPYFTNIAQMKRVIVACSTLSRLT